MKNKKLKYNKMIIPLILALMVVLTSGIAVSTASDTKRPTVYSISPTNNAKDVPVNEQIMVVFSEDMDPTSINSNTVTVIQRTTPESGAYRSRSIEGTIKYDQRTMTFTPNEKLYPNTEFGNVFTVTLTGGIKDVSGNSLWQDYVWSFTTGSNELYDFNTGSSTEQQDQSPTLKNESNNSNSRPMIYSISPVNNAKDVTLDEQIKVIFSEDMDSSSINKNTFTVIQRTTPALGEYRSNIIDGTIKYNDRTAVFIPNEPLYSSTEFGNVFTVTLTGGIKDVSGNSLWKDYVWSFTTGSNDLYNFNTDSTTSQQNQNAPTNAPTTTQISPPITTTTVEGVGTNNSNDQALLSAFPWGWIIGGLIALGLILLVFLFVVGPMSEPDRNKTVRNQTYKRPIQETLTKRTSPFGDVHKVMDLEGIGPKYNQKLNAMGIFDTKQLWKANPVKLANSTGVSLTLVNSWQNMAELASVKGIGPQYAELLDRSGIHSIEQLRKTTPSKLLKLVRDKQNSIETNIQKSHPGPDLVESWIHQANIHKFSEYDTEVA